MTSAVESELDIVIPVYNEKENIIAVLDSFQQKVRSKIRVLICYDFDEDNTLKVLHDTTRWRFPVLFVKNSVAAGPHGAVMSGFQAGQSPAVVMFPADDTFNANLLDPMLLQQRKGSDVVCASRFIPGGTMQGCPFLKAFLVRMAAWSLYYLGRCPTKDPTNGFRLFSRRLLQRVKIESNEGFTYSIELLAKCHRLGWNVTEVPALWFQRSVGRSRFKIFRWAMPYMKWYFYIFATTYLGRSLEEASPLQDVSHP